MKKSRVYVLVFDGFALFEASIVGYIVDYKHEFITVGVDKTPVRSEEGFTVLPDITIGDINIDEVDCFVVPGGNAYSMVGNAQLKNLLKELNENNTLIGAICHGPVVLADAGLLTDKKFTSQFIEGEKGYELLLQGHHTPDQDVLRVENIITARGNAFIEFAFALFEVLNVFSAFKNPTEAKDWYYKFFKNIK